MSFNILDREQTIHRNAMLEASAGTGKTFAIENVVLRLLIQNQKDDGPLPLEKILVVTFTKAATKDLKCRIRSTLERSIKILKGVLSGQEDFKGCSDYLLAHIEQGNEEIIRIKKLIERALFSFDQAQIFTIHSFCRRMLKNYSLEGGISLGAFSETEQPVMTAKFLQVIRDFLRTEMTLERYSSEQLNILLKSNKGQVEKLQEELLRVINRGIDVKAPPLLSDLLCRFKKNMEALQEEYSFEGKKIIEDFYLLSPSYNGLRDKSKQIYPEVIEKINRFSALFDKKAWDQNDFDILICDGLFLSTAFDPEQLSKKALSVPRERLHYKEFIPAIDKALSNIVSEARNEKFLFARLAHDCQEFVKRYQYEEETLTHNDLLVLMQKAIKSPSFAERVRNAYLGVIIDEFQDTDPVQWQIFSSLFSNEEMPWKGYLYLVGDPKQSIYAFRQADIYTYLAAANKLGPNAFATLDTNFRSQPGLVDALNTLFSASEGVFDLPKLSKSIAYKPVKVGKSEDKFFKDSNACLHFWIVQEKNKKNNSLKECEKEILFPAIAKELLRLQLEDKVTFEQCAILIADRFQAERLTLFLKTCNIPVKSQRGKDLTNSSAVDSMKELLKGIFNYKNKSYFKIALGGRIIGMNHQELLKVNDQEYLQKLFQQCSALRDLYSRKGFGLFYYSLMQSCWNADGKNIGERLLSHIGGYEFFREWEDLADLLNYEQSKQNLSSEDLIEFLENFNVLLEDGDERLKFYLDQEEKGVSVLTTHVSKGLEFDVVFSLGLIKRTKGAEELIPFEEDQKQYLLPVESKKSAQYIDYCEEIDAEKMRQLYVALTRAKYRVYIPVLFNEEGIEVQFGEASPMELFLARLNTQVSSYAHLYQKVNKIDSLPLVDLVEVNGKNMQIKYLEGNVQKVFYKNNNELPKLIPPPEVIVPSELLFMHSFSSLTHSSKAMFDPDWSIAETEELVIPHAFNALHKDPHTLPSSNETGLLLHRILETFPFHRVNENDSSLLSSYIYPLVVGTPFEAWKDVITQIIFQALTCPLFGEEESFCLADVDPKRMFRETEFLYPCSVNNSIEGINSGYLKGVVDLFFEFKGKYYLLDWKSNWLGPTQEHYQYSKLEQAMKKNSYDLQAKIYIEALKKYLKIFDKRPFEEIFGGAYYFFLRGVSLYVSS